jgi:hypothetical protein
VHKGLEGLLLGLDIEDAILAAQKEWDQKTEKWQNTTILGIKWELEEGRALVEGLVRGWYLTRFDKFMEDYEVICVEKEVKALLAPNVTLQARADGVIRKRADGTIWVLNWKTSSSITDWTQQWEDEVQAWTEALAMEDYLGQKVAGVIFEGFFKGVKRDGMYTSPTIYGWSCPLPQQTVYSATYKAFSKEKPWRKFPVWRDFPGGVKAWVEWMDQGVLSEQFVRSEPILKNDQVVEAWIRQVVRRETDIEHILEVGDKQDKDDFFWQNFKKYNCKWCPFKPVCKMQLNIDDAISAGQFVPREDHHAIKEEPSGV